MNTKEFIDSTIGMNIFHPKIGYRMVRVEFYGIKSGVQLVAVSANNLKPIRSVGSCIVTDDEFSNRPYDEYNNMKEFEWAFERLGFSWKRE